MSHQENFMVQNVKLYDESDDENNSQLNGDRNHQNSNQDKQCQSINTGDTPSSIENSIIQKKKLEQEIHQIENQDEKIKEQQYNQKQNQNYQKELEEFQEGATQTKRIQIAKQEVKEQMIFLRKTTSQDEFEKTIQKLINDGQYILLTFFLIESEIYNNQMQLLMMLNSLYASKKDSIFNNLFCQKEIIKYLEKCGDIGKIGDILYIAFLRKDRYEKSFFRQVCQIIQKKIDENKNEQSNFFLTNFFRIMVNSKRLNKNSSQYVFPQKSQINADSFITKILIIIQYVLAYVLQHYPQGLNFSNIEVIKVIIDYIFLLKTEDINQVHYIKFLFELIKPSLESMDSDKKYLILRYILECIMIRYDDKDPVKYPYSSSILLAYFENIFLDEDEDFDIDKVFPNISELSDYEIKNLMINLFYSCPTEFVFLIMQQLGDRLCKFDDPLIQKCLYQDIFKDLILAKVIFSTKKEGKITQLCNLISTFIYIFQERLEESSQSIYQILKYNNFIFHSFSDQDQIHYQSRVDDYCKVVKQIIMHKKLTSKYQELIKKPYQSVKELIKDELQPREFNIKSQEYREKLRSINNQLPTTKFIGLQNFGNTCYFNSLIQILMRIDLFHEYLFETKKNIQTNFFKNNRQLMNHLRGNEYKSNLESLVSSIIGEAAPLFKWGTQNDPQEFLINYIKKLYFDSMNITNQTIIDKSPVLLDLFNIEKFGRKMCSKCKRYSNYKKEQFNCIQLLLQQKTNLDFFELTKQVSDSQLVQLFCQECQSQVKMDKDELYSQISPILVFQISRVLNNYGQKDFRKVTFPEFFNFLEIQNNGINFPYSSTNYRLVGVVNHIGDNTLSGHYISFMRYQQTNKWIKFNDSEVSYFEEYANFQTILDADKNSGQPYLLIYQNFSEKKPISQEKQIQNYLDRFNEYDKYYIKDA